MSSSLCPQGVEADIAAQLCEKETTSGVLPTSGLTTSVRAAQSGLVMRMEARTVARLAQALGAGRSHPKGRLQKKSGVFQKNISEMRLFSLFFEAPTGPAGPVSRGGAEGGARGHGEGGPGVGGGPSQQGDTSTPPAG